MLELLVALTQTPLLDGGLIHDNRACYTISMTRDGVSTPVGVTWQTVEIGRASCRERVCSVV